MADDRLANLLDDWSELDWRTKRQIDWIILKAKFYRNHNIIASLVTGLAVMSIMITENVEGHLLILSIIALLHFYIVLADKLLVHS